MENENLEKLRLLQKAIKQINQRLFVTYLILSFGTASILTIALDFILDLRLLTFIICLIFMTYVSYRLIFEIKFSRFRKRLNRSENVDEEYRDEIKEGFISLKLYQYKFRLYLKDCVYILSDDFVFAFQYFRILAIFKIDKSKSKEDLEVFLSKFKNQNNLKLISSVAFLFIIMAFIWKISLVTLNQNFFNDDSIYKVQNISISDTVIYDISYPEYVMLTTNFLTDSCPESGVVKLHSRLEYFGKIRLTYSFLIAPVSWSDAIIDNLIGLYSYQINKSDITLTKDKIRIEISKISKNKPCT
jgi:hypothetical protein